MDDILQKIQDVRFDLDKKISDVAKQVDTLKKEFNMDQINERMNELEDLQMLLQAEMIELSNIVTGQTTPIFSKDIEKRLSVVEDLLSQIMERTSNGDYPISKIEERFAKYDEILQKLRNTIPSEDLKSELLNEIEEKIKSLEIGSLKEKLSLLSEELNSLKSKMSANGESQIPSGEIEKIESLENKINELEKKMENVSTAGNVQYINDIENLKSEIENIKKDRSVEEMKAEIENIRMELGESVKNPSFNSDIETLKASVEKISNDLKKIESKYDESHVEELKSDVENEKKNVEQMKLSIDELRNELEKELKSDVENEKKNVEQMRLSIDELRNELEKVKNDINARLNGSTDKNYKELEKAVKNIEEKVVIIEKLSERVLKIENKMNSFADEEKVKEISEKYILENLEKFAKVVDDKFPDLLTKKDMAVINAKLKMLFSEIEAIRRNINAPQKEYGGTDYREILKKKEKNERSSSPKLNPGPIVIE